MRGDAPNLIFLAGGAVIAAVSLALLDGPFALASLVLGCAMLAIALVDGQKLIIPDVVSLPAIPAGLIATGLLADHADRGSLVLAHVGAAVLGALTFYAIRVLYQAWRKQEGLGLGDVKLAAVAGAWTGVDGLARVLLLACVAAFVYVAIAHRKDVRSLQRSTAVPFGVFLAPSIWLVWYVAQAGLRLGPSPL